jgi:hypothetical protein
MYASPEQCRVLLNLQDLDNKRRAARSAFDGHTEKEDITKLGAQAALLVSKQSTLRQASRGIESHLSDISERIKTLTEQQNSAQSEINENTNNYHIVAARSEELKRLEQSIKELHQEEEQALLELERADELARKIQSALSDIHTKEQQLSALHTKARDEYAVLVDTLNDKRDELLAALPGELVRCYEEAARKNKGVALARFQNNACSVCRAQFDHDRTIALRSEAPLSSCPVCGRLLLVE